MEISELSLDKFGSIGGDYFEMLIAVALDELGYIEGKTYIPSWYKKCVPGTWIEADFIITDKKAGHEDPLNHPRFVFAVGHATSENSAQMKFHRDVEQLLEVKALANGADIMVVDILFCCPRETMGGWSSDLIGINEAIFDNHLIVWKYDWGLGLLKCLQDDAVELSTGKNETVKRKNITRLLKKRKHFRDYFDRLKTHIQKILTDRKSHSKIQDMFAHERLALPERLKMPLMVTSQEKTEYKRGLIQVLALNDWELKLLYENHHIWLNGGIKPLETLALENGLSQEYFEEWWERLNLLSIKIGNCERKLNEYEDTILSEDTKEYRFFAASKELGYVFERFDIDALTNLYGQAKRVAKNLSAYISDLRDLSGPIKVLSHLFSLTQIEEFIELCHLSFNNKYWRGVPMTRLLPFETAKAAVEAVDREYSYDKIANESGNEQLIRNPFTMRFIAGKRNNIKAPAAQDGLRSLGKRFMGLDHSLWQTNKSEISRQFIYDRFDGMVKQPKGSVLDALLNEEIKTFAKKTRSRLEPATVSGIPSAFNAFVGSSLSGVNVEIPYVLILPDKRRIFIHRVNANEGHAADKRKEFSSKIRSIRYRQRKSGIIPRSDYFSSILIIDGKWVLPKSDDPYSHIQMLTVAGWDYVVYPDGLSDAFAAIKKRLAAEASPAAILIPEEEELLLAAEPDEPIQLERERNTQPSKMQKKK